MLKKSLTVLSHPPNRADIHVNGKPSQEWVKWFMKFPALFSADVPALHTDPGTPGQIVTDASFIYVCVAKNSWKRVAIASW